MRFSSLFILSTGLLASASPLHSDSLEARTADKCKVVEVVVKVLKLYKATPYCSSFLNIQTVTTTLVVPSTVTEPTTTTAFETITTTLDPLTTTLTTSTVTEYVTVQALKKRTVTGAIPDFLRGIASREVSSGCSCLSIPTPTSTVTSTSTVTEIPTVVVPATITETATPDMSTVYAVATTTSTVTQALPPIDHGPWDGRCGAAFGGRSCLVPQAENDGRFCYSQFNWCAGVFYKDLAYCGDGC